MHRFLHAVAIYIFSIAVWLDEGLNVTILPILRMLLLIPKDPALGNAHYTVSQWTAYAAMNGSRLAKIFCHILTIMFKPWHWRDQNYSHCYSAIHYEDGTLIPPLEIEG